MPLSGSVKGCKIINLTSWQVVVGGSQQARRPAGMKASQKDKLIGGWPIYLAKWVTGRPGNRQVDRCINLGERESWTSKTYGHVGSDRDRMPKKKRSNHRGKECLTPNYNWMRNVCSKRLMLRGETHTNTRWEIPSLGWATRWTGRDRGERKEWNERIPFFCFCLPPGLLPVRAKLQKPIQVGHSHAGMFKPGVEQRDGEIMSEGDKQERKRKKSREAERVGVFAVPEISLMAAVSFYLMAGRRRAGERGEGQREMKRWQCEHR